CMSGQTCAEIGIADLTIIIGDLRGDQCQAPQQAGETDDKTADHEMPALTVLRGQIRAVDQSIELGRLDLPVQLAAVRMPGLDRTDRYRGRGAVGHDVECVAEMDLLAAILQLGGLAPVELFA